MKKFAAMLVAVTFFLPAFAQKTAFQGTHPIPKASIKAPVSKPILLHTGKPITEAEKKQLVASVIKANPIKAPVGKINIPIALPSANTTILLTPDNMNLNGVAYVELNKPNRVDYGNGNILLDPFTSNIGIIFNVQPNTAYVLVTRLFFQSSSSQQSLKFTIWSDSTIGNFPAEELNLSQGPNEVAYAFVSNSAGTVNIGMSSSNASWNFLSCEITPTPMH
jgi:hypothetical protein